MSSGVRTRPVLVASAALLCSAIAAGIAGPSAPAPDTKAYYYVSGHIFGAGEEQVYTVSRTERLQLRYRDAGGAVRTKIITRRANTSLAWTIEGFAPGGGPVLAVAASGASRSGAPQAEAPPSPVLDSSGAGSASGALGSLAPYSYVLEAVSSQFPEPGKTWNSSGGLVLDFGLLTLNMRNLTDPSGADANGVLRIESTGDATLRATVRISAAESAALRGGGSATSWTFIDPQNRLLLGFTLSAASRGNARVVSRPGTYVLDLKIAIRMARYIPGTPAYAAGPNFIPASAYLGRTEAPENGMYSTAQPDKMASPAPTDTEFMPGPVQAVTPYPSTLPEVSLPPIPIPQNSGQSIVSPPPPPTPTPAPTRYF